MRHIGCMGSHGTGKSTFARGLCDAYRKRYPQKTISLISGTARQCGIPINRNATEKSQLWIFSTHIQREAEAKLSRSDFIISDRTCLDSLAYTQASGFIDLVDACFPLALHLLEQYTDIIYFPPTLGWLQDDGIRDTDPHYQRLIHEILMDWIITYQIPVTMRGDGEDDIEGVYRWTMAESDLNTQAHHQRAAQR